MARGRFLSKTVSVSEQMDSLIDAEGYDAGLLVTWAIPHLDAEGRMAGSPKVIKAAVCPYRDDMTGPRIAKILDAAQRIGLLRWYSAGGPLVVWYPGFLNHQSIRADREARSRFPAYTDSAITMTYDDYSRSTPGVVSQKTTPGPGPTPAKSSQVSKEGSKEVKSRQGSGSLETVAQLADAICSTGCAVQVNISNTHRERFSRLRPILEHEAEEARRVVAAKRPKNPVAFFLAVVETGRTDAAEERAKGRAPPGRSPEKRLEHVYQRLKDVADGS